MLGTVLSLGALGLAAAVPLESRQVVPHYPETKQSKGFSLVANVTDPSKDLNPPINHWRLASLHVGAGLGDAVLESDFAWTFYLNGTAEDVRYGRAHTLADGGTPPFPWGIAVDEAGTSYPDMGALHGISINAGSGEAGIEPARFPEHYPTLLTPHAGTYVACNQTEPYYRQNFITVRAVFDTVDPATGLDVRPPLPDQCVAITLVPQCADLPDLPEGSQSSHQFANTINCYEDVASIKWSEYGP
ncbi:hypothetical protein PG999_008442 [Apiospora kogelbergensis]|uniref:DUF7907 domain-containing protein n=1 Tax=Apiospora kogelbergensis TaxID=1337665 RepID=A0AAW0QRU3_9PEZI